MWSSPEKAGRNKTRHDSHYRSYVNVELVRSFNGKPKATASAPHSRLRLAVKRNVDDFGVRLRDRSAHISRTASRLAPYRLLE